MFAKLPGTEPVKSRLQTRFTRAEAEHFYMSCLADALETASRVEAHLVLFLVDADVSRARSLLAEVGLEPSVWERMQVESQTGADLGARLEAAFERLCGDAAAPHPSLIIGSDSPSLTPSMLRAGLENLREADLVLGPTSDGGYWSIGVRRPMPGFLEGIAWSTPRVLDETLERARIRGLRTSLLTPWTDVDHPEDLAPLAAQITALRATGDSATARHSEAALRRLGF